MADTKPIPRVEGHEISEHIVWLRYICARVKSSDFLRRQLALALKGEKKATVNELLRAGFPLADAQAEGESEFLLDDLVQAVALEAA